MLRREEKDPLNGGSISFGSYVVTGWPMSYFIISEL